MALTEEQYEFWRRHVRQWRESGLTQSAYAAQHQVSRAGLCRWQQRLADSLTLESPITLVPASRLQASGPLILRNSSWQLELPADTSATWLADLLGQLP